MRNITPSLPIGFTSGYLETLTKKQLIPGLPAGVRMYGYWCRCNGCGLEKWLPEGSIKWHRVKSCGCQSYSLGQDFRKRQQARRDSGEMMGELEKEHRWVDKWCRTSRAQQKPLRSRIMWEIDMLEITDARGDGTCRWRMVARSSGAVQPLCTCGGGHPTLEDARDCEEARKAALALFGYDDSPG